MIMQNTDQNQVVDPVFNSSKNVRKEKIKKLKQFLVILGMLVLTTILNIFLEHFIHPSSLVFVYIVPAIAGAIYYGTWASVLSFTSGFLIFDFCFVEPYYSLHISNPQDIYNVTVYFSVAGLITYLIKLVSRQNSILKVRLGRVSLIEDMSRDFLLLIPIEQTSSILNPSDSLRTMVFSQLGQLALKNIKLILNVPALVFFREDNGSLKVWAKSSVDLEITTKENDAAVWTLNNGEVSGAGTNTSSDIKFYFIPMKSIKDTIGVIGISYNSKDLFPEQRRLLGTITNMTTLVASTWMGLKFNKKKII
jgi:two-component system, OmpR family, sensor histidine kinase KdpD